MKRVASVVVCASVLGVVSASYAKPPSAATPPPAAPPPAAGPGKSIPGASASSSAPSSAAPGKTVTIYYKPSADGMDTTAYNNNKAGALLKCNADALPEKNFSVVLQDGKAYCKAVKINTATTALKCAPGGTLTVDDKFPPAVKAAFGVSDKCYVTGAPADVAASYGPVDCAIDNTGSGHIPIAKPGADTCEKIFNYIVLQTPGAAPGAGVVTSQSAIGAGKVPVVPQATLDAKSVKCPAGSALEQDGNGVVCKKS